MEYSPAGQALPSTVKLKGTLTVDVAAIAGIAVTAAAARTTGARIWEKKLDFMV
jgi:hypothetical protein